MSVLLLMVIDEPKQGCLNHSMWKDVVYANGEKAWLISNILNLYLSDIGIFIEHWPFYQITCKAKKYKHNNILSANKSKRLYK